MSYRERVSCGCGLAYVYVHVLSDDVHVVGNLVSLVVTETTFMSMTIGEVRLVRNGDEVERRVARRSA